MSGPRIGSLCSGYGGLDAAAEQLTGGDVAWVSDIDKGACKILAHRYPDVPNLGDFTKVDWADVESIYMLTAGYPCQPFSHAGKRAGTNDARHLWPEVLRCLTSLRPPFALFENVRGHLSLGFDQVLADLATHEYDARWIVLRAADIGAPHGRARLFILAADARRGGDRWDLVGAGRGSVRVGGVRGQDPDAGGDEGRADLLGGMTLLSTPQSRDHKGVPADGFNTANLCRDVSLLPTPTTTQRGTDSQADDRMGAGPNLHNSIAALLPTPAVNNMGASYTPDEWDAWTDRMKAEHGNGNGHGKSLSLDAQRLLPTPTVQHSARNSTAGRSPDAKPHAEGDTLADLIFDGRLLQTPSAADGLGGHERRGGERGSELLLNGQAKEMHGAQWGQYADAIHRWESILGRSAPEPTQTSTKGNPQLSPRFVEWMMGLPEGWVDDVPNMSRNEKLKALGNGVVTQQAVEAARCLLALEVAS